MSKQSIGDNKPAAGATDPSTFNCSICMELMYKPCVNTCGHSFCFWCMHHAMDVLKTSHACPLCRAPFRHFPAVCVPLHSYLARTFPEEMKVKEEETKKLEKEEYCTESPAVAVVQPNDDGSFDIQEAFKCVECHGLAVPPTVLTCGHVVCCGSANQKMRQRKKCPVDGCVGKIMAAEGVGGDSVCALVDKILCDHLSEREYHEAAAASAQLCSGLLHSEDVTPVAATSVAADADNGETSTTSFRPNENVILTGLASARGSCLNGRLSVVNSFCATTDRYTIKVDHALNDMPKQFQVKPKNLLKCVHFGVGCDGCGIYPITGRRYKCQDCSEEIGFDLCGECYDDGVHKRASVGDDGNVVAAGRFNQQHHPDHSMEAAMELDRSSVMLQWIQGGNPDLSMPQIFRMLEMQLRDEPSDDDED
mmetsp:Transcript_30030/g.52006  ORF Transcript_30030/g.52006 Transcript_30030/m.52006 type:complete len:421 (+) Transcript_30030:172-1434(+)|eukprot:CAMPEP_0201884928 /NCGR_PEP_ID=MMETSP0902-20130614/17628_1 /ASSEMBLY_ACC=CAM_ASM_000551 /TAXON_ID=420261 /ORGANISM="Thalassiosira antarctica, Strain CCMP982" /LENGTH=420 /DNA_ID=CAMNT_0048413947 /DNA_START=165 /DNA_END=1427 /DNA_ORIENTATION=+